MKFFANLMKYLKERRRTIAVLRLSGIIGANLTGFKRSELNFEKFRRQINKAFKIPKVKAVALIVNSPGGSAVQSELIHNYIVRESQRRNIPVYTFVEDVAASGGYWLACVGSEIYASENSIIGSIGVISASFGLVNAIKKLGVERRIITQGKNKSIADPFLPVKGTDKKIIEAVQKDIYESFKALVIKRRTGRLSKNQDRLFSGEIWSGRRALSLGLIDGINDLYTVMEEKYGKRLKYEFVEKEESWLKQKLGILFGSSSSSSVDELVASIKEELYFDRFSG